MEIWEPKPPETLWATPGMLRDCVTFILPSGSRENTAYGLKRSARSSVRLDGMLFGSEVVKLLITRFDIKKCCVLPIQCVSVASPVTVL